MKTAQFNLFINTMFMWFMMSGEIYEADWVVLEALFECYME